MSLFIGKDLEGNGILHITEGVKSATAMKSGVLDDTIFHNDLEFTTFTVYDIIQGGVTTWRPYLSRYNQQAYTQSSEGFSRLNDANVVGSFYLDNDNNVVTGQIQFKIGVQSSTTLVTTYHVGSTPIGPDNLSRDVSGNSYSAISSTAKKLVILHKEKLASGPGVTVGQGIFKIGSADLQNLKYAYYGDLNNHPSTIRIDNYLSLVDSSKIDGDILISSNSAATIISKGGYDLFNSSVGRFVPGIGTTTVKRNTTDLNTYKNTYYPIMDATLGNFYSLKAVVDFGYGAYTSATFLEEDFDEYVAGYTRIRYLNGQLVSYTTSTDFYVTFTIEEFEV